MSKQVGVDQVRHKSGCTTTFIWFSWVVLIHETKIRNIVEGLTKVQVFQLTPKLT